MNDDRNPPEWFDQERTAAEVERMRLAKFLMRLFMLALFICALMFLAITRKPANTDSTELSQHGGLE